MNAYWSISKKFRFLWKLGFRRNVYSRNLDYEFIYTKRNLKIMVDYYLAVGMNYNVEIQVTLNGDGANLLWSPAFDKHALDLLKCELEAVEEPNSAEKKMDIYAEFLKKHIKSALALALK